MKELDLSAGGFPERTYVGKNTTVADVVEYVSNLSAKYNELIFALYSAGRNPKPSSLPSNGAPT